MIYLNDVSRLLPNCGVMDSSDQPPPEKKVTNRKLSRAEEAQRIAKEYADELREIIKKLRKKMN